MMPTQAPLDQDGEGEGTRSVTVAAGVDDLIHMQRLTLFLNYRRPRVILALAAMPIMFAVAFAGLIGIMDGRVRTVDLISLALLILVLYGVIATIIALRWLLVPRQARRMLSESPAAKSPVQLAWSTDGLTANSTYGTGTIPWQDLHGWAENDHVFAIYMTRGVAQTLPKRLLSDAQVDDLRRCLKRIPDRRRGEG
ncbi:YcxB family protein [Methylobacterium sp. D54C]